MLALGVDHRLPAGHLVARRDGAPVAPLFRVAAGLESLVPGEGQILGQVRDAYRLASERKAVVPILPHVFQQALRVGKRVRTETGLGQGTCSVASVAVEVGRAVFDRFEDKAVLVIGAGALSELALQTPGGPAPRRAARHQRRPRSRPRRRRVLGGRVIPFERLDDALVNPRDRGTRQQCRFEARGSRSGSERQTDLAPRLIRREDVIALA
jgi:glutamyl-tRNA reductase